MKKITTADIAKIAGVSTATVMRVVHNNGYVAEEKRIAVINAINETGYVVRNKVRSADSSRFIGVILPCSGNLYHQKLLEYLVSHIRREGYHTAVYILDGSDSAGLQEILKELNDFGTSGIICLADLGNEFSEAVIKSFQDSNIPSLMLERGGGYGFDRVLVDTKEGIYIATCHLINFGHRNLAYIGRKVSSEPYDDDVDNERMIGYKKAVWDHQNLIQEGMMEFTEDFSKEQGYLAMKRIMDTGSKITGVITAADSLAAGVMEYLYENKISVPEEISVIGHDDTYAEYLCPSLTTVAMPYDEMARTAVEIIRERGENSLDFSAKTLVLSPNLILRNTVADIRK